MASLSMLVSEFAHSLGQPNNKVLRENLKLLIIHTRNEIIRRSYENHSYVDKVLTQRFKVSLTDVNDGEIVLPEDFVDLDITTIKRTTQKVPKPVRLVNNLPFDRVSTIGVANSKVFPYIKETTARFRSAVPGLKGITCYDYINGYIYLFPSNNRQLLLKTICIEGAFEQPNDIIQSNGEANEFELLNDDNEWLLSEDMIGQIKDIIYKRDILSQIRETNEIPNNIKFNG
jgi:hypothetical protein